MEERRLYIRTDMNKDISTGHVMRCLSIADAAIDMGVEVVFILADDNPVELIHSRGYGCIVINTRWNNLDYEIEILSNLIKEKCIGKLLIDSYYATEKYLSTLSELTETIYIDDINAFDYPVHTLICYANYYKKFHYENTKYKSRKNLLGMKYVPLRSEFRNLPDKYISEKIEKILVLTGGSDNLGITEEILEQLTNSDFNECFIVAICGRYNPDYEKLIDIYRNNLKVCIHKSVDNLIEYMMDADVTISAGGTTLYELCACGTPTITYSFTNNQLDNVRQFAEDGVMRYVGDARDNNTFAMLSDAVASFKSNVDRRTFSRKQQAMVNGYGSVMIIRSLFEMF